MKTIRILLIAVIATTFLACDTPRSTDNNTEQGDRYESPDPNETNRQDNQSLDNTRYDTTDMYNRNDTMNNNRRDTANMNRNPRRP